MGGGNSSPPNNLIFLFEIADRVIDACISKNQEDSKRIAELSMALHYISRFHPAKFFPTDRAEALRDRLLEEIHKDAVLKILPNSFLLQQHITPYVFLRTDSHRSYYYEELLKIFIENDLTVQESYPYRALERGHLLYKLGHQPITVSLKASIFDDARQIYSFNRDLSYALTHTIIYSTDFSDISTPDPRLKTCCLFLMAQSFTANDIDLFFESCVCFLSQDINTSEWNDMLVMIGRIQKSNKALFCANDVSLDYHPLLVRDILAALILRRSGTDILCLDGCDEGEDGPISLLSNLAQALKGKDIIQISEIYDAYAKNAEINPFFRDIVKIRLNYLNNLAEREVLFEREFLYLGKHDSSIYKDYRGEVNLLSSKIR